MPHQLHISFQLQVNGEVPVSMMADHPKSHHSNLLHHWQMHSKAKGCNPVRPSSSIVQDAHDSTGWVLH